MEPNGSVSAQSSIGQNMVSSFTADSRAKRLEDQPRGQSREWPAWRLLFVHEHCGEFGGAEANIHLTAAELQNRGHAVGLLYEQGTGRNEKRWQELFSPCRQFPAKNKLATLKAALQEMQPDLIYLHKLMDLEVLAALFDTGLPVVRMVHDHALTCLRTYKYNYFTRKICPRGVSLYCVFPCLASLQRNRNSVLPVRWASYGRQQREIKLTRGCARLVVYSQYQKQELTRNGFEPHQIEICVPIRGGDAQPPKHTPSSKNCLLYVGQIIRGKGVDVLLRALARVNMAFECHIVGSGNHLAHCQRLCARLGLEKTVHFWGYVPPTELAGFYLQATAFLMSSLWPEPFGMAGPEAMRYGLPVVAFDAGGIHEWLRDGENGFLVPWKDTERFARRVEELLRDRELAQRLGQAGREWVRQYDSSRQIERLENLFSEAIHQNSNPRPQEQELERSLIGL